MVYALAAVDGRGRVSDQPMVRALGWQPGCRLALRVLAGTAVVHATDQGKLSLSRQGYLRIPAGERRWLGLDAGHRVLLVAAQEHGVLLMHTMAALEEMMRRYHASLTEGAT